MCDVIEFVLTTIIITAAVIFFIWLYTRWINFCFDRMDK